MAKVNVWSTVDVAYLNISQYIQYISACQSIMYITDLSAFFFFFLSYGGKLNLQKTDVWADFHSMKSNGSG